VRRHPHVMLKVDDLAATLAALKAGGAAILDEPQSASYGLTALVHDPSGNTLELIEPPRR
jgi:predicted enzyme related to lactoylglutathione lyase